MPLRLSSGKVDTFNFHYFEIKKRYVVVSKGNIRNSEGLPVRVESACVFGHIFNSAKCDCHFQLSRSLELISQLKKGMVIYGYDDDGRGYGVKYHFLMYFYRQKYNMETEELYNFLKIPIDKREYDDVLWILDFFKVKSIKLITNNPSRIKFFKKFFKVDGRIPLEDEINVYNKNLLLDEKKYLGYLVSYKTVEEWKFQFQKELKENKKNYGAYLVENYKKLVWKSFFSKDFNFSEILSEVKKIVNERKIFTFFTNNKSLGNRIKKLLPNLEVVVIL
jgi:GTP cyclohydrolase II